MPINNTIPEDVSMGRVALLVMAALLAATGCSDGEKQTSKPRSQPAEPRSQPAEPRRVVAALGDSITAGSPLWDPNPALQAQLGDSLSPASQYEYWAAKQLDPDVKFRNCGVFGERTDQIAKRLEKCVRGAEAMVIQGGINDLAQGRSPESVAANLRRMVRTAKAMKLRVVLANVLPWNNGYPGAVPRINRLNRLIDQIGSAEHVAIADFYATLNDPRRPGLMPARLTSDGNHPSVAGYRLLGRRLAPLLLTR